LKQNKGLKSRQERDQVQYEQETSVQGKDPKQVRDKLEKKAKLYEKIRGVQFAPSRRWSMEQGRS
jgi:hypothetical protein